MSLLDRGAEIDAEGGEQCETPLSLALRYGHETTALALLERGATANAEVVDPVGDGETDVVSTLVCALSKGMVRAAHALLDRGCDISDFNANGHNALHLACDGGWECMVRRLLAAGASTTFGCHCSGADECDCDCDACVDDECDCTCHIAPPLHVACRVGSVEVANLLLESNAFVGAIDRTGRTALELAIELRDAAMELVLARHAKLRDGPALRAALAAACSSGRIDLVSFIVSECGISHDACGIVPLWHACSSGQAELAVWLLDNAGADIDWATADGVTSLTAAIRNAHAQTALELLLRGARMDDAAVGALSAVLVDAEFDMFRFNEPRVATIAIVETASRAPSMCRAAIVNALSTPCAFETAKSVLRLQRAWLRGRPPSSGEAWLRDLYASVPPARRDGICRELFDAGWRARVVFAASRAAAPGPIMRLRAWAVRFREEDLWPGLFGESGAADELMAEGWQERCQ
jgi:ankyrin repeat protein